MAFLLVSDTRLVQLRLKTRLQFSGIADKRHITYMLCQQCGPYPTFASA